MTFARAIPPLPLAAVAGASSAYAAILWGKILVEQWPRLMAQGVICGADQGLLSHCAACFPAAALTGLAAGAFTLLVRAKAIRRRAAAYSAVDGSV